MHPILKPAIELAGFGGNPAQTLSTLGGIGVYGALGVIIGPIIAALFLTVWELYSETFRDVLPEVKGILPEEAVE